MDDVATSQRESSGTSDDILVASLHACLPSGMLSRVRVHTNARLSGTSKEHCFCDDDDVERYVDAVVMHSTMNLTRAAAVCYMYNVHWTATLLPPCCSEWLRAKSPLKKGTQ